ncbi:MAG: Calx-beta domain-containing protein, partial [Candidatus Methylomirabilales bacterium]
MKNPSRLLALLVSAALAAVVVGPAAAQKQNKARFTDCCSYTVSEGAGFVALLVQLDDAVTTPSTVRYETRDGTAKVGKDYVGRSGQLFFVGLNVSTPISIPILEDTEVEGNETFKVRLFDATGEITGVGDPAEVTIVDNDAASPPPPPPPGPPPPPPPPPPPG